MFGGKTPKNTLNKMCTNTNFIHCHLFMSDKIYSFAAARF